MLYNIRTLYLMVIRIVYGRMCHEALPDSTDRRPSQGWRLFRGFCRGLGDRLAVLWGRQGYLLHLTTRRYVCTACSACAIARKSWSFFFFFFFFFCMMQPFGFVCLFPRWLTTMRIPATSVLWTRTTPTWGRDWSGLLHAVMSWSCRY